MNLQIYYLPIMAVMVNPPIGGQMGEVLSLNIFQF